METLLVVENEMNRFLKPTLILSAIVLFAGLIRFWDLGTRPHGMIIDEAHFGYIAQSLLETGKDEHGLSHPLTFVGFGDQKLPLQAYLLVPVVKWFGLTNWAVRFPSALAGTLLVIVVYGWLKELQFSHKTALLGSLITAVSPWTFILSRFAYESNLGLLLFVSGLWSLTRALKNSQGKWWFLTGLLWGSTWYAYIAYRLVTVLLLVTLSLYWTWHRKVSWKNLILLITSFGVIVLPFLLPSQLTGNTARLQQIGLFSNEGVSLAVVENRTFCSQQFPQFLCYAIWNKATILGKEVLNLYLTVVSPEYLAISGEENLRYLSVEGTGQFFSILYPLLILGLVSVGLTQKIKKINKTFLPLLIFGLVLSPLPAVLSGTLQKVRLSPLFPFLLWSMLLGWELLLAQLSQAKWRTLAQLVLSACLLLFSGLYVVNFLYIHSIKHDFAYDAYVPDIMQFIQPYTNDHHIIIEPFFFDPIMYYAYYDQIDPNFYQSHVVLGNKEASGFQHAVALGNVSQENHGKSLETAACLAIQTDQPTLYVTNEDKGPTYLVKTIWSQNGALRYAYIYDAYAMGQDLQALDRCQSGENQL